MAGATPLQVSATAFDPMLLPTSSDAERLPALIGEQVTSTEALAPALKLNGVAGAPESEKEAAPAPERASELTVSEPVPELETVTAWGGEFLPRSTSAKAIDAGETVSTGIVPVPKMAMVLLGVLGSLEAMVTMPERAPVAVGAKLTEND